jgi:acetyltransferase-like isoleucine patch superfamily enzyme
MEKTQKQKMLAGQLYHANDPEIQADQLSAKAWMVRYNAALGATAEERRELLRERLAAVGNGAVIRPPFHCDYGYNISLGADVFWRARPKFQLRDSRRGGREHRRRDTDRTCGSDIHGRSSTRSRGATVGSGVWPADCDRPQCVDWRGRHYSARRHDR